VQAPQTGPRSLVNPSRTSVLELIDGLINRPDCINPVTLVITRRMI
jgi:hypothetical protein